MFGSIISAQDNFLCRVSLGSKLIFLCGYTVVQHPNRKKFSFPINCFREFVELQITVDIWVHF